MNHYIDFLILMGKVILLGLLCLMKGISLGIDRSLKYLEKGLNDGK